VTDRPAWLEVSVLVEDELTESVADVLARFAPGGVAMGYGTIEPDPDGEGKPKGPLAVRAYLPFDSNLEDRRTRILEGLWHLSQILPIPEPTFREVAEEDWSLAWKKNYRPLRIGKRLVIVPSWMEIPLAPEDVAIRLDPGMAFGTGMHPTTQLCLQAVEELVTPGVEVIDLGCGSGILSIAATRLGAGRVTAVDIDPEAVRVAAENARKNGVSDQISICQGSLAELLAGKFVVARAQLVLANILAGVIIQMLSQGLARLVAPGGNLILSGILQEQAEAVKQALISAGMRLQEIRQHEDWISLRAMHAGD
jgi:ribosomal protein L11 methyltransferase